MFLFLIIDVLGAPVTSGEYGQVVNLVNQVETSNKESLCEFGGLVETLQQSIVKRDQFSCQMQVLTLFNSFFPESENVF